MRSAQWYCRVLQLRADNLEAEIPPGKDNTIRFSAQHNLVDGIPFVPHKHSLSWREYRPAAEQLVAELLVGQ
jgi:hypothetical protein